MISPDPIPALRSHQGQEPSETQSRRETIARLVEHAEMKSIPFTRVFSAKQIRFMYQQLVEAEAEVERLRALASASASPLPENLRELLDDAFECGHMAWPSPDLPTRAAMRDHAVRTILLRAALPASASSHPETVEALIRLAKEATNGWACYAKRQIEHDEIARLHRDIAALSALPASASSHAKGEPLGRQLALMSIRRWVDEGAAISFRELGYKIPPGMAGTIAAQVWLHVCDVLAGEAAAVCHCGCSRPAHTYYREGGIFTGCKICACEAYEPNPSARPASLEEPQQPQE